MEKEPSTGKTKGFSRMQTDGENHINSDLKSAALWKAERLIFMDFSPLKNVGGKDRIWVGRIRPKTRDC